MDTFVSDCISFVTYSILHFNRPRAYSKTEAYFARALKYMSRSHPQYI